MPFRGDRSSRCRHMAIYHFFFNMTTVRYLAFFKFETLTIDRVKMANVRQIAKCRPDRFNRC